jgi:ribosomal protein S18 acetylase RimI-like enzyme
VIATSLSMLDTISLRLADSDDATFLRQLADDIRVAEFAPLDLPLAALEQLLDLQHRAQSGQYAQSFPDATDHIITVAGEPVGRMLIDEPGPIIDLVDIAVLRHLHGRGIGTTVLSELIARSEQAERPISLHVIDTNPARRLYERLGWLSVGFDGMRHAMTRAPARKEQA